MGESLFSEAYYRELVYTHVDNINLLYVALTRAVEVLCIFIPQSQRGANVGSLLLQSLGHDGDVARLGSTTGRYTAGEAGETFEFGVAAAPEPEEEQSAERPLHVVLDDYPTTVPDLRLRLPSDRYFEQGEEVELAPRNLGILMHRAFENAATREEIDDNIRRAVADAALSPTDAEALAGAIGRQFDDPLVAGWFDSGWNIVRNENEIIVPHHTRIRRTRREQTAERTIRRPDRVMVKEGRAVVVDYKFGLPQKTPSTYGSSANTSNCCAKSDTRRWKAICGTCAWNGSCQSTADVFDSLGSTKKKTSQSILPGISSIRGFPASSWVTPSPLPKKSQRLSTKVH